MGDLVSLDGRLDFDVERVASSGTSFIDTTSFIGMPIVELAGDGFVVDAHGVVVKGDTDGAMLSVDGEIEGDWVLVLGRVFVELRISRSCW